jgi:hypothetical protein
MTAEDVKRAAQALQAEELALIADEVDRHSEQAYERLARVVLDAATPRSPASASSGTCR